MSPWLTLVIGIILGLLVGWLIDLLYRRRTDKTQSLDSGETRTTPPDWATPLPGTVESAALPAGGVALAAGAVASDEEGEWEVPPPGEPEPPAESEPTAPEAALPAEVPAATEMETPWAPAEAAASAAPASGVAAAAAAAAVVAEARSEPEPPVSQDAQGAAVAGAALEPLAASEEAEAVDWPEVSERVAEVAADAEGTAPAGTLAAEVPPGVEALPPAAVAALAASAVEGRAPEPVVPDKLIVIEGIGPVYEAKLHAAGIDTFRQLVEAGPDRLREIIQPQSWQRVNFSEWAEQARLILEGKDEELKTLQALLFSRKRT